MLVMSNLKSFKTEKDMLGQLFRITRSNYMVKDSWGLGLCLIAGITV